MKCCIALLLLCGATPFEENFDRANAAYYQGHYAEAARHYEELVAASVENPVVFYNLGNAYHRQGRRPSRATSDQLRRR